MIELIKAWYSSNNNPDKTKLFMRELHVSDMLEAEEFLSSSQQFKKSQFLKPYLNQWRWESVTHFP